ncbi:MAG: hypothetical protein PHY45_12310 [Rhodocyclaceae bacterium]|nr:hypothetical protein [Rhodocyclaceae bacterium]
MGRAFIHGWVGLPSQGEIYLEHGVPRQVRVDATAMVDVERLVDEIGDLTGLHVTLGPWEADEEAEEMEAAVHVHAQDAAEVLTRLAQASAETFYDRYHKPIETSDTDFDDEAYAHDVNAALEVWGLHWGQVDEVALRVAYQRALHQAVAEIATAIARQPTLKH